MSGIYGMNIKMSIFGESHGASIGLVLDGLPPGIAVDWQKVTEEMQRRAPGKNRLSTQRKESDTFVVQSGFFNGYTTGTPLCAVIANSDHHSSDYGELQNKMRPGHADYAGSVRYQGYNDYRGGGHFSGRLTAPLVFAGAIARQAIRQYGIAVGAHILSINGISEEKYASLGVTEEVLQTVSRKNFPVLDDAAGEKMQQRIIEAHQNLNSVGGVIECMALNVPAGIGAPYFDSLESRLSHALFSIPAIKGVEFGDGFAVAALTGREANDSPYYDAEGTVRHHSNHNGGITGGITNGMPIIVRAAVKPTASIACEQNTIDIKARKNTLLTVNGRHDPCIVQRAVPVVEAVVAWTLWDLLLEAKKWEKA